jgi:hypothetical protein
MKIALKDGKPEVVELPEDCIVLFLARVNIDAGRYCLVFGPESKCLPRNGKPQNLSGIAKFTVTHEEHEISGISVMEGRKFEQGGFVKLKSGIGAGWHPNSGLYSFGARPIEKNLVFVAL